jgi:hypothetical protein
MGQLQETIMQKVFAFLTAGLCALTLSFGAFAADSQYQAAKKQADATFKTAKADCKKLGTKGEKDSCMKKAKADHDAAIKQAKAAKK